MEINLAGCVIIKDDAILLLHRIKTDWYELPGGKVEENEDPQTTAIRELKEELNIDVEIIRKIGQKDFSENNNVMHYTWYLAEMKENQIPRINEPEKFDRFEYINIKDLQNHQLSPNMVNFSSFTQNQKSGYINL